MNETRVAIRSPLPVLRATITFALTQARRPLVKKVVALLALAVACGRNPGPGNQMTGAPAARLAADQFMKAVAAQDLQAMSVVWGTEKGAARDQLDRSDLEKRLILIQSCYLHDRYVLGDEAPGQNGHRMIKVTITRGRRTKTPTFELVRGPSDRWYVLDADFDAMQEMCRSS